MKLCIRSMLAIGFALTAASGMAQERREQGVREVTLSERPIEMRLPIGKEVIIRFPQSVTHTQTLDVEKANAFTTLLTPDGILYVTAVEPFDKTRVVAELVDGRLIMMDFSGMEMGPFDGDLRIREPSAQIPSPSIDAMQESGSHASSNAKNPYKPAFLEDGAAKTLNMAQGENGGSEAAPAGAGFHEMVRYGFRHVAGPARLIGDDLGEPVKVGRGDVSSLIRMNEGRLSLNALKQWEIGSYYLTVLLVNNRSGQEVAFDPRAIRGRWVFAAALHPVVEPRGSRFDQTLWALISKVPFDQARR